MKRSNVFVSDCGNYIAIRVVGRENTPGFDVWRHDGSEYWEATRYVQVPGKEKGHYLPRRIYTEEHANPRKIVGSWTNLGHEKRNGKRSEAFMLTLNNLDTNEGFRVQFHTAVNSLAPLFNVRREKTNVR